jgi:threonine/homoserine/homoserine lactone efflux protein
LGISFLIEGILIGLAFAAPLGPIGILCISCTLAAGPRQGFICGLGAAAANALYALAGCVALWAIAQWVVDDRTGLRVIGGVYLVYLGARTFMRPTFVLPSPGRTAAVLPSATHAVFMIPFRVTLANPVALLGFAAIFAGLGVAPTDLISGAGTSAAVVAGVFLGSALWWLAVSSLIGRLRSYIGPTTLTWINRIAGTVLTAFGLYAIAALLPLLT